MKRTWIEVGRITVPISSFIETPSPARVKGPCIYIVRDQDGDAIYVGQTTQLLKARFTGHFFDRSPLARAFKRYGASSDWMVDVVFVSGDLTTAERAFIAFEQPVINTK